MINYFRELLSTLKDIRQYLKQIAENTNKLSGCVSSGYGQSYPTLRTGKNQYEN